jgi:hypothetical protein
MERFDECTSAEERTALRLDLDTSDKETLNLFQSLKDFFGKIKNKEVNPEILVFKAEDYHRTLEIKYPKLK